jgi:uncharacterized membrane protein HdeD (DUF308 family)
MKKYLPIYLYGTIIIIEGLFLLFSTDYSIKMISLTSGIVLILGAVLAFFASFTTSARPVQHKYHKMHSIAMLIYGLLLLVFCSSFERFTSFTAFLLLFYSFSEIIFCNWLFNLSQRTVFKIIIIRFLLGLAAGFGTIIALNFTSYTLEVYGVLFLLVGINVLLYVPVMKRNVFKELDFTVK